MKKRRFSQVLSCILALLMIISVVPVMNVSAIETDVSEVIGITENGIKYSISDGEVTITGCRGAGTELIIPPEIEGYPVTRIGEEAFSLGTSTTSITISEGVTSIGDSAFEGCTSLTSITIPSSVTNIGNWAFSACTSLTSITIPKKVTTIGTYVFFYCKNLTSVVVDEDNTVYDSRDNCNAIIETNTNTLVAGCASTIIPKSVTSIGDYAFCGCRSLTNITIPEGVASIGDYAFSDCESLISVIIPSSIISIGDFVFSRCESLSNIVVDEGNAVYDSREDCNAIIQTNTNTLFAGCASTVIPKGVTSIGVNAFFECESLTSILIPEGVTSVDDYAFFRCSSLTSITISEGVTSIGMNAFYDCSRLTNITIPPSVTSIEARTLAECTSLTSVKIPDSITIIEDCAFDWCISLTDVYYGGTQAQWEKIEIGDYNDELLNAEIHYNYVAPIEPEPTEPEPTEPEDDTVMGELAYEICDGEVTIVGYMGFATELTIPSEIEGYPVTRIGGYAFSGCLNITSVTIPNSVTSIGDHAFSECVGLSSITIPDGVTSIMDYAFCNCESLTSVTIPSSVTNIGECAFSFCISLTDIVVSKDNKIYDSRDNCNAIIETNTNMLVVGCVSTVIPREVTSIGDYAFFGCGSLTSITISDNITIIGGDAFSGCESLTSIVVDEGNAVYDSRDNCNAIIETNTNTLVAGCISTVIPKSVTSIGDHAFYRCTSLTNITIPKGVKSIGEWAFYCCKSLESVTISKGVTSIDDCAFYGCERLTSITIPSSVTSIGDLVFSLCTSLISVTISDGVTSIGNAAFAQCTGLTSITIPDSVTSMGGSVFSMCTSLTSVKLPNRVTSITENTFSDCSSLSSIIIPESVTNIEMDAFYDCRNLTSITIPSSITNIEEYAFEGCKSLTDVYYCGIEEQWEEIEIGDDNDCLLNAEIHYNYVVPTEPVFPESYITDEQTNISVATDTDAELVVSQITSDKDLADIDLILVGEKVNKVFDISLQRDGVEIQPDGKVWVRIPAENPESKIYRMEKDGTLTDMGAVYNDGYLIFSTEHFSLYVVVESDSEGGTTILLGDANSDGKVNIKDATEIQKSIAGILTLTDKGELAADVDGSGKMNIKDATAIQKYLAGIETGFEIDKEKTV